LRQHLRVPRPSLEKQLFLTPANKDENLDFLGDISVATSDPVAVEDEELEDADDVEYMPPNNLGELTHFILPALVLIYGTQNLRKSHISDMNFLITKESEGCSLIPHSPRHTGLI
jgi:hypothetical protein